MSTSDEPAVRYNLRHTGYQGSQRTAHGAAIPHPPMKGVFMKPKVSSWRTGGWIAACVAVGVLVSSCGSDDPDTAAPATVDTESSTATSPETDASTAPVATSDTEASDTTESDATGDPCADRDALRDSIGALTDVDVVADGTNGLTAAIDDVSDDLAAVRDSAGDDIQPEVEAVRSALDDVQTAVSDGPTDDLEGTADALSTLASSTSDLLDALDAGPCSDSAPSTT